MFKNKENEKSSSIIQTTLYKLYKKNG